MVRVFYSRGQVVQVRRHRELGQLRLTRVGVVDVHQCTKEKRNVFIHPRAYLFESIFRRLRYLGLLVERILFVFDRHRVDLGRLLIDVHLCS